MVDAFDLVRDKCEFSIDIVYLSWGIQVVKSFIKRIATPISESRAAFQKIFVDAPQHCQV